MLSSKYRFHSRGGVKYVYAHGKTIRHAKISLVHCVNTRGYQRFAVVVSKKVDKRAVVRNKIRRRVYEAIRLYKKANNFRAPKDLVFVIYSKDFMTCAFSDIERQISSLIRESMI